MTVTFWTSPTQRVPRAEHEDADDGVDGALGGVDGVEDGLLEGVVEDGPGEEGALGVAGGGGEVELGGEAVRRVVVEAADDLVPLAGLVVGVVGLVVEDEGAAGSGGDAAVEVLDG